MEPAPVTGVPHSCKTGRAKGSPAGTGDTACCPLRSLGAKGQNSGSRLDCRQPGGQLPGISVLVVLAKDGLGHQAPKITRVPVDGITSFFGITPWSAMIVLSPVQCIGMM